MPDNTSEYRAKYTQVMQVPAPDELITGWYTVSYIRLTGSGDILRGTLLMSTSAGTFTPATAEGAGSADELCILCDDVLLLEDGQTAKTEAYFSGTFKASEVILTYETENDSHSELMEAVSASMRKHNLLLREEDS